MSLPDLFGRKVAAAVIALAAAALLAVADPAHPASDPGERRATAGETADPAGPVPDPLWQRSIEQAVDAVARQDAGAAEKLEALRDQGRGRRGVLLVQLALFLERSGGTERSMPGALLFHELAFTPQEKLDAILPHLDDAGPKLRRVFTEMLSTIDRPEGGEPDFRLYEELLRARSEPPAGLVLYMMEASPDRALESLERAYGPPAPGRGAPWSAVAVLREFVSRTPTPSPGPQEARAALEEIARDPAWWRRLYAAAVARAHPGLVSPELAARLAADPHAIVRQAARAQ